jgi:hypothetical protein
MNPTSDTSGNSLQWVARGVSNLLQQVSAISAADFNRRRLMAGLCAWVYFMMGARTAHAYRESKVGFSSAPDWAIDNRRLAAGVVPEWR